MEDIKSILQELKSEVLYNRTEITAVNTNISKIVTSLEKVVQEFQTMKTKINEIEKKVDEQEKEIDFLAKQARLNNLVLIGIPEHEGENLITTIKDIFHNVNIEIPETNFDNVYRLGKIKGKRPILLKLNSNLMKQAVMNSKMQLRELGLHVFPDRTKKDRDAFQRIKPFIIKYKKEGKEVRYRNGWLEMDGRRYRESELEEMEMVAKRKREEESGEAKGPVAKLQQFAFRKRAASESQADQSDQ